MKEMIKKNHEKANREYVEKLKIIAKKKRQQERLDKVLGAFITVFIIGITCICISLYNKQSEEFVETCTSKGYSVNYCMNHM